jgi:hypothetical protein
MVHTFAGTRDGGVDRVFQLVGDEPTSSSFL